MKYSKSNEIFVMFLPFPCEQNKYDTVKKRGKEEMKKTKQDIDKQRHSHG